MRNLSVTCESYLSCFNLCGTLNRYNHPIGNFKLFENFKLCSGPSRRDDRLEYYIPLHGPLPPSELPVNPPVTPSKPEFPGHRAIQQLLFSKESRRSSAPARLSLSRYCFKSFPLKSCRRFQLYWRLSKREYCESKEIWT